MKNHILIYIKNNNYIKFLLIVLTIGAFMRFYGISNAENTDEYNEVMEALRVASGKFNYERWMKKGFQNILAIEYGVYFVFGYLINMFSNPMDFAEKIVRDIDNFEYPGQKFHLEYPTLFGKNRHLS